MVYRRIKPIARIKACTLNVSRAFIVMVYSRIFYHEINVKKQLNIKLYFCHSFRT